LLTIAGDVREGFVEITRHSLAMFGLGLVCLALTFTTRPDLEQRATESLSEWVTIPGLNAALEAFRLDAAERSTALYLRDLPPEQQALAYSLRNRYRVAAEPLGAIIQQAWTLQNEQLPATLLLAVAAVESGFNPFMLGPQGTLGMMQIDPQAEAPQLQGFGGRLAAFDALTNLKIGARVLQREIAVGGSLEEGVQRYGALSGHTAESLYAQRVLAEHQRLQRLVEAQKPKASTPR
jgi:soluble lytic murein transglycosylase-like protein